MRITELLKQESIGLNRRRHCDSACQGGGSKGAWTGSHGGAGRS